MKPFATLAGCDGRPICALSLTPVEICPCEMCRGTALTREHDALCHIDGSICEDGCDAAPVYPCSRLDRRTV